MIDALILLDSSGQHVTTRSYKSGGVDSSYRVRLPTKLMTLIAADSGCQSFPAVSDDDDSNTRFVTISRDGIYLIGMVSDCENIDNILILSMLDSAHSIMRKYYGCAITDSVLKSNFTTVYLILDEILDGGYPFSFELNNLESTVVTPSVSGLVDKLASVVSGNTASLSNSLTGVSPEIWWRRAGVSHSSNEFYIDVVDRVNLIMSPTGKIISGSVSGSINANSHLSGLPDILLALKNPKLFVTDNICFHPCVRIPRWLRDQKLSFTPPDGTFVLAEYTVFDHSKVVLPLTVAASVTFDSESGRVRVSLKPRLNLLLPAVAGSSRAPQVGKARDSNQTRSIEAVVVRIKTPNVVGSGTLVTQSGSVRFDPVSKTIIWSPGTISADSTAGVKMEGTLHYSGSNPNEAAIAKNFRTSASVQFSVSGWSASGIKIDSVDVGGVDYTPYKGCRYSTCAGRIDFRI